MTIAHSYKLGRRRLMAGKVISPEIFISTLEKHYLSEHGVINYAGAMDDLASQGVDLEKSCLDLCNSDFVKNFGKWEYAALVVLHGLLVRQKVSHKGTVDVLLELTNQVGKRDQGAYYKTISALSHSTKYAKKLLDFADYFVTNTIRDGAWLACSALGLYLVRANAKNPDKERKLLKKLKPLVDREPSPSRRGQMLEIMEQLSARLGNYAKKNTKSLP